MIEAPKRSVTRFFIPLVDIMMLLFSMFLLLPILEVGGQAGAEKAAKNKAEDLTLALDTANKQIRQLSAEVAVLRKYADPAMNLELLRKEIDELKKSKGEALKKMLHVQVLRWDSKLNKWEYFDEKTPKAKPLVIKNKEDAEKLIKEHQHQAKIMNKTLQYLQVFPMGGPGPVETRDIDNWFAGVWIEPVVLPPEAKKSPSKGG
jgi:hypothetical protein